MLYEELNVIRTQLNSEMVKGFWNKFEDKKKFWEELKKHRKLKFAKNSEHYLEMMRLVTTLRAFNST